MAFWFSRIDGNLNSLGATIPPRIHGYGMFQVNAWFDPRPLSWMGVDDVDDEEIGFGDIFTVWVIRPASLRYD